MGKSREVPLIGIIGGTGFYDPSLFEEIIEKKIYTSFGEPSSLIALCYYKGRKLAFIPRHGKNHTIPPHKVNYRANIWALKELGVDRIIAGSTVGSLREKFAPGEFVIPDQFIDRTKKRLDTFYESGQVCHISPADPFCPELRKTLFESAQSLGLRVHSRGVYICIEGPRFSTRAESKLFRQWGGDIIGMTLYPECVLAKEAQICYGSVAMVTDYDVWAVEPVSATEVTKTLKKNVENFKKLLLEAIVNIPSTKNCRCDEALRDALL